MKVTESLNKEFCKKITTCPCCRRRNRAPPSNSVMHGLCRRRDAVIWNEKERNLCGTPSRVIQVILCPGEISPSHRGARYQPGHTEIAHSRRSIFSRLLQTLLNRTILTRRTKNVYLSLHCQSCMYKNVNSHLHEKKSTFFKYILLSSSFL